MTTDKEAFVGRQPGGEFSHRCFRIERPGDTDGERAARRNLTVGECSIDAARHHTRSDALQHPFEQRPSRHRHDRSFILPPITLYV
jgi:hypothetical protein